MHCKVQVLVAGGVSSDPLQQFSTESSVEILDWTSLAWSRGADMPRLLTGARQVKQ